MTLRPGGGPARLLLELWQAQAHGFKWRAVLPSTLRAVTFQKGFICEYGVLDFYGLTPAGREAAQVLEASTGTR